MQAGPIKMLCVHSLQSMKHRAVLISQQLAVEAETIVKADQAWDLHQNIQSDWARLSGKAVQCTTEVTHQSPSTVNRTIACGRRAQEGPCPAAFCTEAAACVTTSLHPKRCMEADQASPHRSS